MKSLMQQSSDYIQKERAKPPYRESIRKTLLDFQKKTGSECKDLTLDFDSAEAKDELEDLVEFDGTGKAIAGGWREKVPGGVCGETGC